MSDITTDDINFAVKTSGLNDFTGRFIALGGGEVNDTFLLECAVNKVILRVAKRPKHYTLKEEAEALNLLNIENLPKLIFFDKNSLIHDRLWIIETYIEGEMVERLNVDQFRNLGYLLANVHTTTIQTHKGVNLWNRFLKNCHSFGDEHLLLNHPDPVLKKLIERAFEYFQDQQSEYDNLQLSLIHGDATPSNTLVRGNAVSLIDWEFSKFSDPMSEFSTIYYDDIEYHKGKWRPHIKDDERKALYEGYDCAGGEINEERLKLWMNHDKLGAAIFLYWRINQSTTETSSEEMNQYKFDLDNLIQSLDNNI